MTKAQITKRKPKGGTKKGAANKSAAAHPTPEAKAKAEPKGKVAVLVALLERPDGATIEDMRAATGWQAHSVRGAISGSIKRALRRTVTSTKTEAGRTYCIVPQEA